MSEQIKEVHFCWMYDFKTFDVGNKGFEQHLILHKVISNTFYVKPFSGNRIDEVKAIEINFSQVGLKAVRQNS